MSSYRLISSDSHVIEPSDLWTSRIETKFRDRAPHIESLEEGDWWFCDGRKATSLASGTQVGVRFDDPSKLSLDFRYEDVRLGGYIPEEHVKDMDIDGVDVDIVYPTMGFQMYHAVPDSDLLTAICRTYNEWVAEFCGYAPKRLKAIAMINVDDVNVGVKELERCANMGRFAGAMIPAYPLQGHGYHLPEYEPLWAKAEELGMPLGLHVLTNRPGPGQGYQNPEADTAAISCNRDHWVKMSISHMILNGVFERYPKLQVGSVEFELAWVPHFLWMLDYTYEQRPNRSFWYRYGEDMRPSDYFHRNVFISFQQDDIGIRLRDIIGVDNFLWGSDYPHTESTFPRSRQILEEILADCTEEEKVQIGGGNAARIYNID